MNRFLLDSTRITYTSALSPNADAHLEQGELAYHLVKWLYRRTNKHNAMKQIGQCVRQLERTRLAANHHRLNT